MKMDKEARHEESDLGKEVASKAARKIKARKKGLHSVWTGIGMFGLVGWSVVVPSLLGAALGYWLDRRYPGEHSWTLTFLLVGIVAGCLNAWYWIQKENRSIHQDLEDDE
ncbi:MAG: AtpZ/AtpI family protein [Saprospiraceae bacterium]|nr:AtpZ/AtpI family protein [Saprospiraceae bacterium]